MIPISLHSDYIINLFNLKITNTFFTSVSVTLFLIALGLTYFFSKNKKVDIFLESFEVIVYQILKIIDSFTGNRTISKKVLPLVATFFIFICAANFLALIPGFLGSFYIMVNHQHIPILRSPNSDITTTLALALISVSASFIFAIQHNGWKGFLMHSLIIRSPIGLFLKLLDMISTTARVISFSFRLFGNMFAGEVLLLITAYFIPYFIPLPFMIMELFVGLIQAYIFAILSLSFINSTMRES